MDVLRVLSASDLEVRKKTLQLALDLVSSRNVEEMVMFLRKVSKLFAYLLVVMISMLTNGLVYVANFCDFGIF